MEELARVFAEQAHFLFIYTREAHPGENYPHLTSFEQKMQHAKAFRQRGLGRTILLDSLEGQVHRMYGGLSNTTWIVDHTGHVGYKASWTDSIDIRTALEELLLVPELRRQRSGVPFFRELSGVRRVNRVVADDSRYLGGKKAAEDVREYWAAHRSGSG